MHGKIGVTMKISTPVPKSNYVSSFFQRNDLSQEAQKRLKWFDHYYKHGNARLTCRYFGISPQTFYRWKKRYNPQRLKSLEKNSSRPLKVREPETSSQTVLRIQQLREQYPRWGRDKIKVLLEREGIYVSASTVGRIINRLKERGVLKEPTSIQATRRYRKRRWKPRYAVRKPDDYAIKYPGDLVEIDTVQIKLLPDLIRYQFTARDIVTRRDGIKAYSRQSSFCGKLFLEYLEERYPFSIKAIQIDGGSEFKKDFEQACKDKGILLFVLPPRSPKLNGHVERANGTHRSEFYEVNEIGLSLEEHNRQLEEWENTYNYIRPHQSLDYLTPDEYYQNYLKENGGNVSLTY